MHCGHECKISDHFCSQCGFHFPSEQQETQATLPTPPTPAEPISKPPLKAQPIEQTVEGETPSFRKHVTVLFADMKSSTEMIRNLDPEEAKELLFPALEKLSSIVYQYGGIVISKSGDEIVAAFGAPQALEDHALRACLASLAMKTQIKMVNPLFSVHIGLNSGEILFYSEGAKYDIVGAVVNLAARMEQTAKPDTIRLTQDTLKLVATSIDYESLGMIEVKGFAEPVEVFELKGIKISKTLDELTNQFIECTSFIDKESEIAKVNTQMQEAKSGHGKALSLVADSGFGKSRFVFEVVQSSLAKEFNILLTAAFIHTKDIPLLPISNLFAGFFNLSRSEIDVEKIKTIIAPFLQGIDLPMAMNCALSLLNLTPKDPEWSALEPALKRKYTFEMGIKLFISNSLSKPLMMICEDIHWIDSETELFIDALISSIGNQKIFILMSYRPEYRDHWVNKENYSRVEIPPFNHEGGMMMLDHLLGKHPSLVEIKKKLLTIFGGNPFFLEELISSLITGKVLIGEPQNYYLAEGTSVHELHLPETIATIYQIKIDTLLPLQKKILQIASVIGMKFVYSILIQLMEVVDENEIRVALNQLTDLQYIYKSQLYPEPGFGFTHALTYETAYNSILKKTRKAFHFKLFQILESQLKEDQLDQIQIVAEHAYLSETWDKAVHYCIKAAAMVYELSAFSTCVKLYEKALNAIAYLTPSEELSRKIMLLHYELYYAYVPLGRFKEQYDHLNKALEIALANKDRLFESILNSALGIYFAGFKDAKEALNRALTAHQIALELQSTAAISIAQFSLIHIYLFLAQFKELFETLIQFENLIERNLDYRSEWLKAPMGHIARCYESWGRSHVGDFTIVEERKEEWFKSSPHLDRPSIPNMCRYGAMGMSAYLKGEFENGIQNTMIALQYSLSTEVIIFVPIFLGMLAHMHLLSNQPQEGKIHLDRAVEIVDQVHATFTTVYAFAPILESLLLLGDVNRAKEYCDQAMQILKERSIELEIILLLRISGEIDLLQSPQPNFDESKKKLEEALHLATEHGMIPQIGRCQFSLAHFYKKKGEEANGLSALEAATAAFEKVGMKYWSERSKNQSF